MEVSGAYELNEDPNYPGMNQPELTSRSKNDELGSRELGSLCPSPNMYNLHTLMNVTSINKLNKLTNFCEHIGFSLINEDETDCALNLYFS